MNDPAAMFNATTGWTSGFEISGKRFGGPLRALSRDERVKWHLQVMGGARGKRVLELGPLEGAHTKMFIEAGAKEVIAIEGNPNCWLRCLIVQQVFGLANAKFLLGDFCEYVANFEGEPFDFVSAAGVLYHLTNPAKLIHDLAPITNCVIVWSQVANATSPSGHDATVEIPGQLYRGRANIYGGEKATAEYCGGLHPSSFWLYASEMRRCFKDAGFSKLVEEPYPPGVHGECVLFVAMK